MEKKQYLTPFIDVYAVKSGDICQMIDQSKATGGDKDGDLLGKETDWEDEEDDY